MLSSQYKLALFSHNKNLMIFKKIAHEDFLKDAIMTSSFIELKVIEPLLFM